MDVSARRGSCSGGCFIRHTVSAPAAQAPPGAHLAPALLLPMHLSLSLYRAKYIICTPAFPNNFNGSQAERIVGFVRRWE